MNAIIATIENDGKELHNKIALCDLLLDDGVDYGIYLNGSDLMDWDTDEIIFPSSCGLPVILINYYEYNEVNYFLAEVDGKPTKVSSGDAWVVTIEVHT